MKPLLRVLAGEPCWPPPIWLMRQAGRYLPEYRSLRAQARDFIEFCMTPDLAVEATLQPLRRYDFDAAILFSDILILPWALGRNVSFVDGEGPALEALQGADAIGGLDMVAMPERVAPVLEAVRRIRAALDTRTTLIGFAGAPFTVACYLIEGGSSSDFAATRRMAHAEPELFARLIDRLVAATITYLAAQIEAGAEAVMLFDSWAGILPPYLFRQHVVGATAQIVSSLKARFPTVPVVGFPRLAGLSIGAYAAATGVAAVGLDTAADPLLATSLLPERVAAQGNLDPTALVAGGTALEREARAILEALRGRPHVFNLGHGVMPATPPEHVAALVELVRAA
jgi:uroporphyrinogen decarboxylase